MVRDIDIRCATVADVPLLLDMRERMLVELGADDPDRLRDLRRRSMEWMTAAMLEERARGWIATRRGEVVGGVSMTVLHTQPQYRSPGGRVASVYGLYVLPSERGAGIATALVHEAVAWAKSAGIDIVTLHAAEKARPIYERIGFSESSEMRLFVTDGPDGGSEERR